MSTARIITKYPNRRLYDTEESRYITLADIKDLVLAQTDLIVVDKKTGANITRAILLQVISDQEQNGDAIMSEDFLAKIISCYGKVAPANLAKYLEQCLQNFTAQPQNFCNNEAVENILSETKNSLTSGP